MSNKKYLDVFSADFWRIIAQTVKSKCKGPEWLLQQIELPWETISNLKPIGVAETGKHACPAIHEHLITKEYLLLTSSAAMPNLTPEMKTMVDNRSKALAPFLNQKLIKATFSRRPGFVQITLDSSNYKIIFVEIH